VLNHAVLDSGSITPSLGSATAGAGGITWSIPVLPEGASATLSYTVTVDDDAFGVTLRNVATGSGDTPPDECPAPTKQQPTITTTACTTEHETPNPVDLRIDKDDGGAVVGDGDQFEYSLTISNVGQTPATDVHMSDPLPDTVEVDPTTLTTPAGWTVALGGTNADGTGGTLTADFPGPFDPGDEVTITMTVTAHLPQPDPTVAPDPIVNTATVSSHEPDEHPEDNTDTEETPVKAVTLQALGICRNDVPFLQYSMSVVGVTPTLITFNWWNPTVWNGGNPTGPPSHSQTIPLDQLSGELLWFGAAVDAQGNPTDWPGWTLLPDGTWVEDPNAPGADLRPVTVVQITVNPEIAATQVYPPATPLCDASPPPNQPPGTPGTPGTPGSPGSPPVGVVPPGTPGVPRELPRTGGSPAGALGLAAGLLVAGTALRRLRRRWG
jgi:uncharacterized repeat protein (TIGR01451 family)